MDKKKMNSGSSNAMPKTRNRREVKENTSRIVQAETTKSLSKPVRKSNISGNTSE